MLWTFVLSFLRFMIIAVTITPYARKERKYSPTDGL